MTTDKAEMYADKRVLLLDAIRGYRMDEDALRAECDRMWDGMDKAEQGRAAEAYFLAMRKYDWDNHPRMTA